MPPYPDMYFSHRQLVQFVGLFGLASLFIFSASAQRSTAKVIVIGAGIAGLAAYMELSALERLSAHY